ncbi:MAG: hypothetical protein LC540_17525 [Candidatus Thiodiazotropha sp.]|nr:hypothetical protein [Candidatus Thiodiazotropha sp.]
MSDSLLPPAERLARTAEKRRSVLKLLRDEIWTHITVIQELLNYQNVQNANATMRQLERDNLVRRATVDIPFGKPTTVWGITGTGLNHAFDLDEQLEDRPSFEPGRIKAATLQHRIDLQLARVRAEKAGWTAWTPGHLLGKRLPGVKLPDAIATSHQGVLIAVEVERTIKSKKRYADILVSHLMQRKAGNWDKVFYLSPTLDFAARVERVFNSIETARHNGQVFTLSDQHRHPFFFFSLDTDEWLNSEDR